MTLVGHLVGLVSGVLSPDGVSNLKLEGWFPGELGTSGLKNFRTCLCKGLSSTLCSWSREFPWSSRLSFGEDSFRKFGLNLAKLRKCLDDSYQCTAHILACDSVIRAGLQG